MYYDAIIRACSLVHEIEAAQEVLVIKNKELIETEKLLIDYEPIYNYFKSISYVTGTSVESLINDYKSHYTELSMIYKIMSKNEDLKHSLEDFLGINNRFLKYELIKIYDKNFTEGSDYYNKFKQVCLIFNYNLQ
jgi:hypothetical protein